MEDLSNGGRDTTRRTDSAVEGFYNSRLDVVAHRKCMQAVCCRRF